MRDGVPAVTDGPLAEAKEHFGGYLIVDCESIERATEIAARWPNARFAAMEVRPIMDDVVRAAAAHEDLLRGLAPQVLGALVRRHGNFDAAEDAVQEALAAAAVQWPAEGVPEHPRAWLTTEQDPLFARALAGEPADAVDDARAAAVNPAIERALGHRAFVHLNLHGDDGSLQGSCSPA